MAYDTLLAREQEQAAAAGPTQPQDGRVSNDGTCSMWEQDGPCTDARCKVHGGS